MALKQLSSNRKHLLCWLVNKGRFFGGCCYCCCLFCFSFALFLFFTERHVPYSDMISSLEYKCSSQFRCECFINLSCEYKLAFFTWFRLKMERWMLWDRDHLEKWLWSWQLQYSIIYFQRPILCKNVGCFVCFFWGGVGVFF